MNEIFEIVAANRASNKGGIYSVCCAQPLVIEAAIEQAKADGRYVLIEATANQVNQFGGYTGMRPADYMEFIGQIADKAGFPRSRIIPGGDHLGPVCWVAEGSVAALEKAKELVRVYVKSGFKKIHLDASMSCSDDPEFLSDEIVAERAAMLCAAAESAAHETFGRSDIVYIIGTEVPPPGGAAELIHELELTSVERVAQTMDCHKVAFERYGLSDAWSRVVGLVVQPGVEFDHTNVVDYNASRAVALSQCIKQYPNIVFEAHSTDYQVHSSYAQLVADHFAILKVGPQLTYAMREALFALSYIEEQLLPKDQLSFLRDVLEEEMEDKPGYWKKFYVVPPLKETLYRQYSYSDRIRYYWNNPRVESAVQKLLDNLKRIEIPLPLISQFMPVQYDAVRNKQIQADPESLVKHKIMQVTQVYSDACAQ